MRPWRHGKVVALLVAALSLYWISRADAVVEEEELRLGVANSVAVMRYIYQQREDVKDNVNLVEYSLKLTQTQIDAQKTLIADTEKNAEKPEVKQVKLTQYNKTLTIMVSRQKKMTEVDYLALYKTHMDGLTKQLEHEQIVLDAKVTEYRVIFGSEPHVDLEYESKLARLRTKVEKPGVIIVR